MTRSDYLKDQIQLKREKLRTITSKGWEQFMEEFVEKGEMKLLTQWCKVDRHDSTAVGDLQDAANLATGIRTWGDKDSLLNELRSQEEALKEIEDGNAEDAYMTQAGPILDNPRMSLWRRIREKIIS